MVAVKPQYGAWQRQTAEFCSWEKRHRYPGASSGSDDVDVEKSPYAMPSLTL